MCVEKPFKSISHLVNRYLFLREYLLELQKRTQNYQFPNSLIMPNLYTQLQLVILFLHLGGIMY